VLPPPGPLVILHFPLRSWHQFESKIAAGGSAYQRNDELPDNLGTAWRDLYQLHLDGSLREHFESALVDAHDVDAEIAAGRLIVDRRLAFWMRDHPATPCAADADV